VKFAGSKGPKRLEIAGGAARMAGRGHPWIYREAIVHARGKPADTSGLASGTVVDLLSEGRFISRGLFDATSPLAVRIYTRDERDVLDASFLCRAIDRAWEKRDRLFDERTTAYRAVNGEGDRIPGVVIDRYGSIAVLRLDGDVLSSWLDDLAVGIARLAKKRGIETLLLRNVGDGGDAKTRTLSGREVDGPIDVLEHGVVMEVDVLHGQKTGAFLDQRENRRRVRDMARPGMRALNLFSYAGGFSVSAALGGAKEVTSVDIAAKAHTTAQRIFQKNGIAPSAHKFVTADATMYVEGLAKRGESFDLVISDPPSFAPNEKSKQRGLVAYSKLHAACARLLAKGGIFCAASCSSHVTMEDFLGTLDDQALGRRDLSVAGAFGPPDDHPSVAAFPEGRYLKFVVLR